MSEMLQLLVIHPHDDLMPGDIVDLTEDAYEERTRSQPFAYFAVLSGALQASVVGTRLPPAPSDAELPPAFPGVAASAALDGIDGLTSMTSQLHAEDYQSEVAPPFAVEVQVPVIDDSTPMAEPIPAVLEGPVPEPMIVGVPVSGGTMTVEEAKFMEQLPPDPQGPVEVPSETARVVATGGPPKGRRGGSKK